MSAEQVSTLAAPGVSAHDWARRLGVAGFWRWWVGELAGLLPAGVRAAWQRRRTRPAVAFEPSRATLWRPTVRDGRVDMLPQASVPLAGDTAEIAAAGRKAVATLARTTGGGGAPAVTLCLPARAVLRKTLALPAAVEENLVQALAYDLDRHTPFKPEELYFDAVVVARDTARNVVRVDLAAARRSSVDPLVRQVEGWGARVAAVSPDAPQASAGTALDLLPPELRASVPLWRRWEVWVPAVVLAVLALAATVLPILQKRETAIALNTEAEVARQQAAVSETLRAELERQVGDYNFALERKFAFPTTVQILDDVTRILPDDTWLTQFEIRTTRGKDAVTRELGLRGESANAGRLVGMLEESKLFTQAAPRSPITKIQPGPGEIFDVGAQLKPLPPPTTAPLTVGPRTGAAGPGGGSPAATPAAPPATTTSAATPASVSPAANAATPTPGATTTPASTGANTTRAATAGPAAATAAPKPPAAASPPATGAATPEPPKGRS